MPIQFTWQENGAVYGDMLTSGMIVTLYGDMVEIRSVSSFDFGWGHAVVTEIVGARTMTRGVFANTLYTTHELVT